MSPINVMRCNSCDFSTEYITFNVNEEIPTLLCEKCGKELVRGIGSGGFRFALKEGVWEKGEDGQEKYKGKGGKTVPVHKDGTPI